MPQIWREVTESAPCGDSLWVDHAMSCHKGGFPTLRHNEIRDPTANLLKEVCPNTCYEPGLQSLNGEAFWRRTTNTEEDARLDIRADGFWTMAQGAFFDIRVFHPSVLLTVKRNCLLCTGCMRTPRRERVQWQDSWSRVGSFHISGAFHKVWNGKRVYHLLQAFGWPFDWEAKDQLFSHDGMVEVQDLLRTPEICHQGFAEIMELHQCSHSSWHPSGVRREPQLLTFSTNN